MKENNWNVFKNEIQKISIRGRETQEQWSNLITDIRIAVNIGFPEKERRVDYKFTMSQGLLKSKNKKNKLLRRFKRGEIPKEVYVNYNKVYRKLILKEKESSFHNKLIEAGTNSKQKWKILKDELKLTTSKDAIDEIEHRDEIITDRKRIAETFKYHFQTCAEDLAKNIPNSGPLSILMDQQDFWSFDNVTEIAVEKAINSLTPKSSSGFDCLSNRMLKMEKKNSVNF